MPIELVEVEPGRWRVAKPRLEPARSDLARPYVISDTIEPTEQVDGRYYTSKRQFRAVGRALGLTEVGTEKPKPKTRSTDDPQVKRQRADAIGRAISQYRDGRRPRTNSP